MNAYIYGVIGIIIVLGVLFLFTGGDFTFQIDPATCQILKPIWGYYQCEKSSVPVDIPRFVTTPPLQNHYETYYCTNNDVAKNGYYTGQDFKSCAITTSSPTAGSWVYKVCSGIACGPYSSLQGGDYNTHTSYLDFGEYAVYSYQGGIGQINFNNNMQYFQRQLVYRNWFGQDMQVAGVGCDMRSLLPASEWDRLPANSKQSLDMDERQNFVVGWVNLPYVGNYQNHPTYGPVMCVKTSTGHALYGINTYNTIDESGESGVYQDHAGNCYLVPTENPVATNPEIECCQGETLQGYACNSYGKWESIDVGECCVGGLCTAVHCPGQGAEYCDLTNHRVSKFVCQQSNGMCVDSINKYAECCPPDIGCSGDDYCDVTTYTCKKKPTGKLPCPFACCVDPIIDTTYYQEKPCPPGQECCPGGDCKETCGVEPPVEENDYLWLIIPLFAVLLGAVGVAYRGVLGGIILGIIGGIAGYVIFWFLTLPWWVQLLLGLGLGAGAVALTWLFGGLIIAIIAVIAREVLK